MDAARSLSEAMRRHDAATESASRALEQASQGMGQVFDELRPRVERDPLSFLAHHVPLVKAVAAVRTSAPPKWRVFDAPAVSEASWGL